jgi:hypothetical protein
MSFSPITVQPSRPTPFLRKAGRKRDAKEKERKTKTEAVKVFSGFVDARTTPSFPA